MGAAVAPIIAKVVVSYVVSKTATVVAEKLGFSESQAGIIGAVSGIVAGSMTGAPTPTSGATGAENAGSLNPGDMATSNYVGGGSSGSTGALGAVGAENLNPGDIASGGPSTLPATGYESSAPAIEAPAITPTPVDIPDPPTDTDWWTTLWDNDKTGDVLGGMAGGAAQGMLAAKSAEDRHKAENETKEDLRSRWKNYDVRQFGQLENPAAKRRSGMLSRGTQQ
jgi:hypothetical protein